MLTFLGKFLFFMLIAVYCAQPGFSLGVVVTLYIVAMIITAIVELALWTQIDKLLRQCSRTLEESMVIDYVNDTLPFVILWTVFFAFCHVVISFYVLNMPLLSIAIAVMGFNSTIHFQRMENALK